MNLFSNSIFWNSICGAASSIAMLGMSLIIILFRTIKELPKNDNNFQE
ncbi:hypothetical protein ACXR6G_11425 [Ancylomarina sp. YFZ004]